MKDKGTTMKRIILALLAGTALGAQPLAAQTQSIDPAAVIDTYADIAQAGYADSLSTAKALQAAVATLIANPSEASLEAAKQAWIAARVPYQQTDCIWGCVFRAESYCHR